MLGLGIGFFTSLFVGGLFYYFTRKVTVDKNVESNLANNNYVDASNNTDILPSVLVNSTNNSEVNDGSNLNTDLPVYTESSVATETPSYSSALVGPDLVSYVDQEVQVSLALVEASIKATLPAPLELIGSNSDSTITNVSTSPDGVQYILFPDSPAYVWPSATTGHISVTPLPQVDSASTNELIDYVNSLRTLHSVGVSPISGSPVSTCEKGTQ